VPRRDVSRTCPPTTSERQRTPSVPQLTLRESLITGGLRAGVAPQYCEVGYKTIRLMQSGGEHEHADRELRKSVRREFCECSNDGVIHGGIGVSELMRDIDAADETGARLHPRVNAGVPSNSPARVSFEELSL
jgi:hypothetical protein